MEETVDRIGKEIRETWDETRDVMEEIVWLKLRRQLLSSKEGKGNSWCRF